jgi:uncharacterized protein (DUF433 family)
MTKDYVEQRDGGYWVVETRVSLDSIVYAFRRGASPESIQRSFPTLTLEQIYGAITFYLAHESEIDRYLERGEEELERLRKETRDRDPAFHGKLTSARSRLSSRRS